jgi:cytochrome c oxidase subunit 2
MAFPSAHAAMRIDVRGEQWWWRVNYRAEGGDVISANEVRVPVNTPVDFALTSADVIHSFWIPSLGGKVDMVPGRETTLRLTARRPGIYRGQCAEYCGGPHALMAFRVIAMAPAEFDAWLVSQRRDASNTNTAHPGRRLFIASGCGACHSVRGVTEGVVGPDLTTFAARGSVAIDTLAASRENIARFIREGQHIKPRNLMPEFRVLSQAEAENIADYLASLR